MHARVISETDARKGPFVYQCAQPERPCWRMHATDFWVTDARKVWGKSRMRTTYNSDARNLFNPLKQGKRTGLWTDGLGRGVSTKAFVSWPLTCGIGLLGKLGKDGVGRGLSNKPRIQEWLCPRDLSVFAFRNSSQTRIIPVARIRDMAYEWTNPLGLPDRSQHGKSHGFSFCVLGTCSGNVLAQLFGNMGGYPSIIGLSGWWAPSSPHRTQEPVPDQRTRVYLFDGIPKKIPCG